MCSSGNHGAALARAAQSRGISACVIVPENTPACKRAAIEAYGARIVTCSPSMDAREAAMATELASFPPDAQPAFIPPYNHPDVIAGQGTMALEFLEQAKANWGAEEARRCPLDAIVVPVSGGGMISGVATVVKALAWPCLVRARNCSPKTMCTTLTPQFLASSPACWL